MKWCSLLKNKTLRWYEKIKSNREIFALLLIFTLGIGLIIILSKPITEKKHIGSVIPPFSNATLFIDSSANLNAKEVFTTITTNKHHLKSLPFNGGYNSFPVWVLIQPSQLDEDMVFRLGHSLLDTVEVFIGTSCNFAFYASCGYLTPKRYPAVQDISPCFFVPKELNSKSILIKFRTTDVCAISIDTYYLPEFAGLVKATNLLYGLYFGAIIIMALINIFLFVSARYTSSFWYSFYILSFALFQAFASGLIDLSYINYNAGLMKIATPLFASLCISFGSFFAKDFLSISSETVLQKIFSRIFVLFAICGALFGLMALFGYGVIPSIAISILAPFFVIVCLVVGILRIPSLGRPAIFFTIAISVLTIGIVVNALRNFGVLPNTFLTAHGNLIGSVFEFVIIAIALVDRVSTIEQDKIRADKNAHLANQLATESRLKALQAQINPHFLFNTLNVLTEFVSVYPQRAEKLVLSLSKFFRYTLSASEKKIVSLQEELEIVKTYLSIEKERFGKRLEYEVDVEGDITDVTIPGLIIQPIVENSVKYGITPLQKGGKISLRCIATDDFVTITVHDTGAGFGSNQNSTGYSHGLFNVTERLRLVYGNRAYLNCKDKDGALVTMTINRRAPNEV